MEIVSLREIVCLMVLFLIPGDVNSQSYSPAEKSRKGKLILKETSENGSFSIDQICKAGIATIMGRDPMIMKINSSNNEIISLSYKRKSDGKSFSYRCYLSGNRIIWATENGRWRIDLSDSTVLFFVKGSSLYVEDQFTDGSVKKENFTSK